MSTETTEAFSPSVPQYVNYWGTDETKNVYLDNNKNQYFTIKKMSEGDKAKYQRRTSVDMVVDRNQDSRIKIDPATERHELIKASLVGWLLMQPGPNPEDEWTPMPFSGRGVELWLEKAPPKAVEDLETEIREFNPWMMAELSIDGLESEISRLEDLLRKKRSLDEGEESSTNR